jgi:hypothetical protein
VSQRLERVFGYGRVVEPEIETLIDELDATHAEMCAAQRRLLALIAQVDTRGAWRDAGARDMAQWLWMRYGLSDWKARRWLAAAHALGALPRTAEALATGMLGIDKVVELSRFATAENEAGLLRWAREVSCGAIRRRGDLALRTAEEAADADDTRSVAWWYFDDDRRFALEAELPAAQGAVVAKALARLADDLPAMPGEEDRYFARARRADALVALCSARIGDDPDQDRATVVVHARADATGLVTGGAEIEGGPSIAHETVKRLLCNARVQTVVEDVSGRVFGLGRLTREPSAWMVRQVRYRDRECRFPGCGATRFTQAHHIRFWRHGGRTDLDNLLLICSFHHRLVHEHGWRVERGRDGEVRWFSPDGTRHRAGPPVLTRARAPAAAAAG